MLQQLIIQFLLYYLSRGCLWEVKNKRKFQTISSKSGRSRLREVVASSGSKYSDLTWKLLVFWKTGCWGEVVAYERWSQTEVQLYKTPDPVSVLYCTGLCSRSTRVPLWTGKTLLFSHNFKCWAPRISWLGTFGLLEIFLRPHPWLLIVIKVSMLSYMTVLIRLSKLLSYLLVQWKHKVDQKFYLKKWEG